MQILITFIEKLNKPLFLLKLAFLIFLILITIYLLYVESKLQNKSLYQVLFQNNLNNNTSVNRSQLEDLNSSQQKESEDIVEASNKLEDMAKKSSIFPVDFDFSSWIKEFTVVEQIALGGLCFSMFIVSNLFTIILILYGNYLIKRFDLENRYPNFSKFIQIRQKLSAYYLKYSFTMIFMALLPQFILYITILYPKISELNLF